MALPSDFGGLGNIYNDHKYENVKFYDPNLPENKNKPFIKQVKFERNMIWFPLNPNPESLTKNNSYNPFQALTIFLKQNNNNTIKENKDIINNENNNNNNNEKLKDKDDNNKKEKNIKNDKENIKSKNERDSENKKNKIIIIKKHDRSESGKKIRERSRSISNSEFSDEEKVERYDNKNKKYNHYRYKK